RAAPTSTLVPYTTLFRSREQAVAVLEGKPPLEKVTAANEHARALGIAPGMTRLEAESYGALRLLPRSPAQEAATYAALLDAACADRKSTRLNSSHQIISY